MFCKIFVPLIDVVSSIDRYRTESIKTAIHLFLKFSFATV